MKKNRPEQAWALSGSLLIGAGCGCGGTEVAQRSRAAGMENIQPLLSGGQDFF